MKDRIIIIFLLFIACLPYWVIKKPVPELYLSNKILVVAPLTESIKIIYHGSVENEFGRGPPDILIAKYLQKNIAERLGVMSSFRKVLSCDFTSKPIFRNVSLPFKSGESDFIIPDCDITFSDCDPDIVLFLTNLKLISLTKINSVYGVPTGFGRSLKYSGDFVYWDVKNKDAIAYGKLEDKEEAGFAIEKAHWFGITHDIAVKLLCDEQFLKNK